MSPKVIRSRIKDVLVRPADLAPGVLVGGNYRTMRRIAAGGVGEVWAAMHVHSQRQVVLKRLLPAAEQEPRLIHLFEQEAALLERIDSEFVAQRIEFLHHPIYGRILIQDVVEGEPLSEVLSQQPLSVEEARGLGFNLLRALVSLERVGALHCDLKPSNIILKPIGGGLRRPMLIDFGAARLIDSTRGASTLDDDDLTVGTLQYMPPERFLRREISSSTDLYAVGVILYQAMTGKKPFPEGSAEDLIRAKVTRQVPPLVTGRTDFGARQMEMVVARSLHRDPAERYRTADDMLTDLMALHRVGAERARQLPQVVPLAIATPPAARAQPMPIQPHGSAWPQNKAKPLTGIRLVLGSRMTAPVIAVAMLAGIAMVGGLAYAMTRGLETTSTIEPKASIQTAAAAPTPRPSPVAEESLASAAIRPAPELVVKEAQPPATRRPAPAPKIKTAKVRAARPKHWAANAAPAAKRRPMRPIITENPY